MIGVLAGRADAAPGDSLTRLPFPISPPEGTHRSPVVAVSGDGSFAVAWLRPFGIYAGIQLRLFDADLTPRGPEEIVAPQSGELSAPEIAMARDGRFVVTWIDASVFRDYKLYARLYDANGAPRGDAFRVDTAEHAAQSNSFSVAMAADAGGFAVVWEGEDPIESNPNTSSPFLRTFTADGTPLSGAVRTTAPPNTQYSNQAPQVAVDAAGNPVVVWLKPGRELRAKRFTAAGVGNGKAFSIALADENGEIFLPYGLEMSAAGEFVVAYQRTVERDFVDVSTGVYARHYSADGSARGPEFRVSQGEGVRGDIDVAMDALNRWAVTWIEEELPPQTRIEALHRRLFRSNDNPVGDDDAFVIDDVGFLSDPRVGMDDRSNFVVALESQGDAATWVRGLAFAGVSDTRASCLNYVATRVGTSAADTIDGGPDADVIQGFGGADRIDGGGGDDAICGGSDADVLYGSGGDDVIDGGRGDDLLDGGDGDDSCNGGTQTNADTAVQCESVVNVP